VPGLVSLEGRCHDSTGEADARHLRAAFEVATRARAEGNLPLVSPGRRAGNVVIEQENAGLVPSRDATAHAETVAASGPPATTSRKSWRIHLYASAEPCAMCAGAIYGPDRRVVFGLSEHDLKGLTGNHPDNPTMDLPCREVFASGQRSVEVLGPELVEEALEVFAGYWG